MSDTEQDQQTCVSCGKAIRDGEESPKMMSMPSGDRRPIHKVCAENMACSPGMLFIFDD